MAKILLATYTNFPNQVLDPFRQSLVDALVDNGNHVLLFKTNGFIPKYTLSNQLGPSIDEGRLMKKIVDFDPDVVISLNHSGLFQKLLDSISCPIALWLLDGPAYLADSNGFRNQKDRYETFTPVRAFKEDLVSEYNVEPDRIHFLPFCSDFRNQPGNKEHNISFIGTFFKVWDPVSKLQAFWNNREFRERFQGLLQSYSVAKDMAWNKRIEQFRLEKFFSSEFDESWVLNMLSATKRIKHLEALQGLGLSIYGDAQWLNVLNYSIDLAMCFRPEQILTKEQAENVYNSSNIVFSVSHIQAGNGLPWRVFDALASGAVLVSDAKEDLQLLFGQNNIIPCYETPAEAREICQSLLKDEVYRKEIVQTSNKLIEKGHRFVHRLKTMGDVLGLDLLPSTTGLLEELNHLEFSRNPNGTSAMSKGPLTIPIEVFYSDSMQFFAEHSKLVANSIAPGEKFFTSFVLSKAPKFLRLDVGEWFSTHDDPKVFITQLNSKGEEKHQINLEKDLLYKTQFLYSNGKLICGFDSGCIFENPFVGKDITLSFESTFIGGI